MGLIKLLYEEPEKIHYLILKFIKLLLLFLIVNLIIPIPEFVNLRSLQEINFNISIKHTLFILVILMSSWYLLWGGAYSIFIIIISFFKKSKKLSNGFNKRDLKKMLKYGMVYKKNENGYIRPTKYIKIIAQLMEVIKDDEEEISLRDTSFVEWLYISIVFWFFLIAIIPYSKIALFWFIIAAVIILSGIGIWRLFDKIFEALKENSIDIHNFLQTLLFRKIFIDTIENNFRGQLNSGETHYSIRNKSQEYKIIDFAYFNNKVGNIALKNELTNEYINLSSNTIIASNVVPNDQLIKIIKSLNIAGYVSASNEEELLVRLIELLDKLEVNENKQ